MCIQYVSAAFTDAHDEPCGRGKGTGGREAKGAARSRAEQIETERLELTKTRVVL